MSDADQTLLRSGGKGRAVSFLNVVSLGNLLILAGMIGTGVMGIYEVGGQVQKLEDAVTHETDLRVKGEHEMALHLVSMEQQETRDVANISQTLVGMHDDIRTLMQASLPQPAAHR